MRLFIRVESISHPDDQRGERGKGKGKGERGRGKEFLNIEKEKRCISRYVVRGIQPHSIKPVTLVMGFPLPFTL
jgi:hypothetical protein